MTPMLIWFIFTVVMGCCVGSFLNVVIYRLPAGQSLVTPPSKCPKCATKLAWYDNVPVLGWLWLRGKCRYCKTPISIQYPMVEAFTGALFGLFFVAYYLAEPALRSDIPNGPEGLSATWIVLVAHLVLLASLIAATVIDARHFIIPLGIPYTACAVAFILLPASAAWKPTEFGVYPAVPAWGVGIAAGGFLGVVLANALLWKRLIPLSFDEEALAAERAAEQAAEKESATEADPSAADGEANSKPVGETEASGDDASLAVDAAPPSEAESASSEDEAATEDAVEDSHLHDHDTATPQSRLPVLIAGALMAAAVGVTLYFISGPVAGAMAAFVIACYALIYEPIPISETDEPEMPWEEFPHVRREAAKELLFLVWPIAGMVAGYFIASAMAGSGQTITWGDGPPTLVGDTASTGGLPLWARVLGGSVCGYLAGGGLIWGIRVLGTFGFNKEAMGLGDVHLLGAIGAIVGPIDITIVFFLAPFLGLAYALVTFGLASMVRIRFQPIPYGPHLCMAAIILMLTRDHLVGLLNSILSPGGPPMLSVGG